MWTIYYSCLGVRFDIRLDSLAKRGERMSDLLFTLYEADANHLAIAWGPMPLVTAIDQATDLVGESSHTLEAQYWHDAIRQEWLAFEIGMNPQDKDDELEDSTRMAYLCEWLNQKRNEGFDEAFYRYFYTEEARA